MEALRRALDLAAAGLSDDGGGKDAGAALEIAAEELRAAQAELDALTDKLIEKLKTEARARDLWNLFLPDPDLGAGLSVLEYAPLAEITGRSPEIAPEALNRFYVEPDPGEHGPSARVGATWMTRHDREHEIRDYVDYLDRLRDHVAPTAERTVVLGFSQGAETASRWAVMGGVPPAALILWGGGLAADLDPRQAATALGGVDIAFVVGDEDAWALDRAEAGIAFLAGIGVGARRVEYHGGHRVDPDVLARTWP